MKSDWLTRWWCKKYNRPRKDPLLSQYTLEELYVEYLEEQIDEHGGVENVHLNVGSKSDPIIVSASKDGGALDLQHSLGNDVDVFQLLSPDERERAQKFLSRKKPPVPTEKLEEFNDDYTKDLP